MNPAPSVLADDEAQLIGSLPRERHCLEGHPPSVEMRRLRATQACYKLDGRDDPRHPYHHVLTGCGRPFTRLIQLEDKVADLEGKIAGLSQWIHRFEQQAPRVELEDFIGCGFLSRKAGNCLLRHGFSTLSDVADSDRQHLLSLRGFGVSCLAEVESLLSRAGLSFQHGDQS